jgi:hypothetical protein
MLHDAQTSRDLQRLADLGKAARNAAETITSGLHDGLALTIYATDSGVYIDHGPMRRGTLKTTGPHFDLHQALCALASGGAS